MEKKIAKLDRQTQQAIHTLIRELTLNISDIITAIIIIHSFVGQRLAAQNGQSDDLVGAMRAEANQANEASDSDNEDDA
jgi:coiled-coil domain-containing protein 12